MTRKNEKKYSYKYKFSIIMPVYNVQKYLAESIESLLSQTLDFKTNSEIILVNDGSTDGSEDVCLNYKNLYPNNIRYIKQKNAGPGAARNKGLEVSLGQYVSFLDPDDMLSDDSLSKVYDFFNKHGDKIDVVAIRYNIFEAKNHDHPLNYKFLEDKIADLDEDPDFIQMSVATAFFKRETLEKHRFKEDVGVYSEDAHLIGRILLEKRKYGLLKEPSYYYRKRHDQSSSLDGRRYDLFWYFETPYRVWRDLLQYSLKHNNGSVPDFIQYMVIYEIQGRLRQRNRHILNDKDLAKYKETLTDLLDFVDNEAVLRSKTPVEYRLLMLSMKTKKPIKDLLRIDKEGDYSWKKTKLYRRRKIKFAVDSIEAQHDVVTIKGWYSGYHIDGIKFFAEVNKRKIYLEPSPFRSDTASYSLGSEIYNKNAFTIKFQHIENTSKLQFGIESGKEKFISSIYKFGKEIGLDTTDFSLFAYDSANGLMVLHPNSKTIEVKRATNSRLLKYEQRYIKSQLARGGILIALSSISRQAYDSRRLGIPLRFIGRLMQPNNVLIATDYPLKYGDISKPPKNKKFYLNKKNKFREVRMATIMDDFTYGSFKYECDVLQVTPDNWLSELKQFKPDILFIESAWRGKDELWKQKISKTSDELLEMVRYCKSINIPTVFWNKEDPAHTFEFIQTASMFDFIFTTDSSSIDTYRYILGHSRIYLLPFASQPADHNPVEKYARKDKFNFAGSYYPKYEERNRNFKTIVDAVTSMKGLDIYDRNYNKDVVGGIYKFEGEYERYVKGSLAYSEIDKAYKGYRYAITLNTIKNSPTMFARRAFELMASNTITIGNYSKGILNVLGDLTIASDDGNTIKKKLKFITKTRQKENAYRLLGLRKVLSEHSYKERLRRLLSVVFDDFDSTAVMHKLEKTFMVVALAQNEDDIIKLHNIASNQHREPTELLIMCNFTPKKDDDSLVELSNLKKKKILKIINGIDYVAVLNPNSYYGIHYTNDLMLATDYSDSTIIGKSAYFTKKKLSNKLSVVNEGSQYKKDMPVRIDASIIKSSFIREHTIAQLVRDIEKEEVYKKHTLAIDEFNYSPNISVLRKADFSEINGILDLDLGLSINDIYRDADEITNNNRRIIVAAVLKRLRIVHTRSKNPDF